MRHIAESFYDLILHLYIEVVFIDSLGFAFAVIISNLQFNLFVKNHHDLELTHMLRLTKWKKCFVGWCHMVMVTWSWSHGFDLLTATKQGIIVTQNMNMKSFPSFLLRVFHFPGKRLFIGAEISIQM